MLKVSMDSSRVTLGLKPVEKIILKLRNYHNFIEIAQLPWFTGSLETRILNDIKKLENVPVGTLSWSMCLLN